MVTSKEIDQISLLKEEVQNDPDLLGLYHFGSSLHETAYRDIDLCVVIKGKSLSLNKRLKYRVFLPEFYDVRFFDEFPLYIKHEVLKTGKCLLMKDEDAMYDIAYDFCKQYADFEPHFRIFLEYVKNS